MYIRAIFYFLTYFISLCVYKVCHILFQLSLFLSYLSSYFSCKLLWNNFYSIQLCSVLLCIVSAMESWRLLFVPVVLCSGMTTRQRRTFARLILDAAYSFFLPPFSFQIRVGALYLLHSLYDCQTGAPREQVGKAAGPLQTSLPGSCSR